MITNWEFSPVHRTRRNSSPDEAMASTLGKWNMRIAGGAEERSGRPPVGPSNMIDEMREAGEREEAVGIMSSREFGAKLQGKDEAAWAAI